jgi:hypothetical protein
MSRATDPLRMLTASLIGAAWRTVPLDERDALGELQAIGSTAPQHLPQAAADAARFWIGRADDGQCDIRRARLAADRIRRLAVDEDGKVVAPSPRELKVTAARDWKGI